ncbi:hypothetical protein [Corallococcus sp. RDP092CA]|uniref:hypothetical protein n=1 Tax=Corallococcus sp. RDP092CA TaxID=3109369 RepID=UPI0035ADC41C
MIDDVQRRPGAEHSRPQVLGVAGPPFTSGKREAPKGRRSLQTMVAVRRDGGWSFTASQPPSAVARWMMRLTPPKRSASR